jgi:hypothetical protein
MLPAMNIPALQSPDVSQTKFPSASGSPSGNQADADSQPSRSSHADSRGEATDDDSVLIALGNQFEEAAAEVQRLYNLAEPDSRLEQIEAALARLEPLERAIMTIPARTTAGLGVKARHAAYVMSEYWNGPIDRIDWDARAVRLLIEAVCKVAHVPCPFGGAAGNVET